MSRRCTIVFAIGFVVLLGAAQAQDKKGVTIRGWGAWIDPDGDCELLIDAGKVTITVPKTPHDFSSNDMFTRLNAPRILQPASGDFEMQVTAPRIPVPAKNSSSSGFFSFLSCGLLIRVDDKTFIRMERASEGNGGAEFIWVELFKDSKPASHKMHRVANQPTILRLERKG